MVYAGTDDDRSELVRSGWSASKARSCSCCCWASFCISAALLIAMPLVCNCMGMKIDNRIDMPVRTDPEPGKRALKFLLAHFQLRRRVKLLEKFLYFADPLLAFHKTINLLQSPFHLSYKFCLTNQVNHLLCEFGDII